MLRWRLWGIMAVLPMFLVQCQQSSVTDEIPKGDEAYTVLTPEESAAAVEQLRTLPLAEQTLALSQALAKYRHQFRLEEAYKKDYNLDGDVYLLKDVFPDYATLVPQWKDWIENGVRAGKITLYPFVYVNGNGTQFIHQQFQWDDKGELITYAIDERGTKVLRVNDRLEDFMQVVWLPYPKLHFVASKDKGRRELGWMLRVAGTPCVCTPKVDCWQGTPHYGEVSCGKTNAKGDCPKSPPLCCPDDKNLAQH